MSAAAKPFMKFYPQDWRADEKLRMCSLAARGLWMEMLAIMHRSERYGHLLIGGNVPTDAQLAVQAGAPPGEVTALLAELDSAGVFSRAAGGAIYSRRMTRDEKKAKIARQNGKTGGNPKLRNISDNPASDNHPDKPPDKGGLKPQRPEARGQKEEGRARDPSTDDFVRACQAAALIYPPGEKDRAQFRRWIADGISLETIVEVAERIARREHDRGKTIGSLGYLDRMTREQHDADQREVARYRAIAADYGEQAA